MPQDSFENAVVENEIIIRDLLPIVEPNNRKDALSVKFNRAVFEVLRS